MKIRILFPLLLLFFFFAPTHSEGSSWQDLELSDPVSSHWSISERPMPEKPGAYYISNTQIEKCDGYLSFVLLYPEGFGVTPEEEIKARMDRFLQAQPKDLFAVRSLLTFGDSPAEQLVYYLKDPNTRDILAWFVIIHWAQNGNLYSLSLCSLTDSPLPEVDLFLTEQLGPKTIKKEIFLPQE